MTTRANSFGQQALAIAAATGIALALAATAEAASVSVVKGQVVYVAAPGERNAVYLDGERPTGSEGPRDDSSLYLSEIATKNDVPVRLKVGPGCHLSPGGATCEVDYYSRAILRLGDLNDAAGDVRSPVSDGFDAYGGPGDDSLNSFVIAGAGPTLDGGPGNDDLYINGTDAVLRGGSGDDAIEANEGNTLTVDAGDGDDAVDVDTLSPFDPANPASIKLGKGDDSLSMSQRSVSSPRETRYGTFSASSIPESAIDGGAGIDLLNLPDSGGLVFDLSAARTNLEIVDAESTDPDASFATGDLLIGSDGYEVFRGTPGPDIIIPGARTDWVRAGAGADRIITNDGAIDHISCGTGNDLLRSDEKDDVWGHDCEKPF